MMTSYMLKHPKLRSDRLRRGKSKGAGEVIDITLEPENVMKKLISGICGEEKENKLNYLKAFVEFSKKINGDFGSIGYHVREVLICLRVSLVHTTPHIRSAGLKAIRHTVYNENDIIVFNSLSLPYLVARCLDLSLKNDAERLEAMKLIRKVLLLSPSNFSECLARCLISLANSGIEERDRMLRICLATLCELGVLNSQRFIETGGVAAITRNLLECQMPKISESLCGTLLYLLDKPRTRDIADVDLDSVATPYCDFHYKHDWKDKNRDERDLRFNCSRLAMLTILRSWSGLLHFCSPTNKSGLIAITGILHLNQLEVRKAILDLLYELLGLPQPDWTDELSVALSAVDPSEPQLSWRLNEGFVVAEGQSVLPHLAKYTPRIIDMHLAVVLYCFQNNGLIEALVEVIATSDTFISVRATVLLGRTRQQVKEVIFISVIVEMATFRNEEYIDIVLVCGRANCVLRVPHRIYAQLHPDRRLPHHSIFATTYRRPRDTGELLRLIQLLLPPECCNAASALPSLLDYATKNSPQAIGAITALVQFHKLLKKRPVSHSLYLDFILRSGSCLKNTVKLNKLNIERRRRSIKSRIKRFVSNSEKDIIKDTGVLVHKDHLQWNWNLIRIIIKGQSNIQMTMNENSHKIFLRRLVDFFLPSNNKFSHMDLTASKVCLAYTMVGIELIQFLVELNEPECVKLLNDLFTDILSHISALTSGKSVHDCLFSPQHMVNTQCQYYFLFVGRLATTELGLNILNQINMFHCLQTLATTTNNDCYVKLIISSMDYSENSLCQNLLTAILKCGIESSRLYATQFLLILLRSGITDFATWGIPLLVGQLKDQARVISLCALSILHEACESLECLEVIINTNIDFDHLGARGNFLLTRLLSHPNGLAKFCKESTIIDIIKKWDESFIYHYVKQVEDDISDSLTLHQRGPDGKYDKRLSNAQTFNYKDLHLPPHLYGQLSRLSEGFKALIEHGSVTRFIKVITNGSYNSDEEILEMKACIWALAHLCTSSEGIELLLSDVVPQLIHLAENASVYSVRATAYYSLGLIGTTQAGADEVYKMGWVSARHNRHEIWPLSLEESLIPSDSENGSEDGFLEYSFGASPRSQRLFDDNFERNIVWRKSSTLPNNRNSCNVFHQRSMSESKTFEMSKNYEQRLRERVGLSKQFSNRSTESSMSSGDFYGGSKLPIMQVQTLSPIPSSSNVVALNKPKQKIRRYSESSRRDSAQCGNMSCNDKFSQHSNSHKLSNQDLLGYTTLHYVRNHRQPNKDFDVISGYTIPFNNMSPAERNSSVEDFIMRSSLSSLTSAKNNHFYQRFQPGVPCYMGISLPQHLNNLFPIKDDATYFNSATKYSDSDNESQTSSMSTVDDKLEFIKPNMHFSHSQLECLECSSAESIKSSQGTGSSVSGFLKQEIIQYIELLSNPLWNKQSKLALLQLKQENPRLFEDPCLYSEACKIISENNFRLNIRRIIHELFFEVNYINVYEEAMSLISSKTAHLKDDDDQRTKPVSSDNTKIDEVDPRPKSAGMSPTQEMNNSLSSSSFRSITDINDLKFSYKENKFPIKHRDT